MSNNNNNAIVTLRNFGILADPSIPLSMYAVDGHESHDLVLADATAQENATVVQSAMKAGKALDFMVIRGLALLKRAGAHKDSGYDGFGQFAEALTGMNRTTANSYANAGDTFTDEDGNPVKPFVSAVSVATLNQLAGLLKASVYVYRAKVDFDFVEVVLKKYNYSLSVARVNELIKLFKRGDIPSDLVTIVVKDDGTHFYLCDSDIELVGYTSPEDSKLANTAESSQMTSEDKESKESKESTTNAEKSVSELVSDAITALGKLPMSDELKARFDVMYSAILNLTADIVAYKPDSKPDSKPESKASKETKKK